MSSLHHHRSIQKGAELNLSDPHIEDSTKDSQRVKFLLDGTTSDLHEAIRSCNYDVNTYEDPHAGISTVLQAAIKSGRIVLTLNYEYHNNELFRQSSGVLVLPLELKHESAEAKVGTVKLLLEAIDDISRVRRYPINVWMVNKDDDGSWKLKPIDPDDD